MRMQMEGVEVEPKGKTVRPRLSKVAGMANCFCPLEFKA